MIRNILILTVLAALVPTAMSSVSASSEKEIALFSGGGLASIACQYQAMATMLKWNLRLQTITARHLKCRASS
jgi:hypothetical protein